jgi:uncharacterized membrane protein
MVNIGNSDPSGPASDAYAITPDGSLIVGAAAASPGAPSQAALWTGSSGPQILGSLSPTDSAIARAVSADGRTVVGTSGTRAFIWRQGRGMEDLQAVLAPPAGWNLTEAMGISADGRIVVGSGYPANGNSEAWIATVPPPCPADFNGDGLLNSQDFFDFVGAFFGGTPNADFNGDGQINSQDFFDFVTAFFAGCP